MAAIGKIRSKGKILAIIIGLALFSFIAEELFRSCQSTRNDQLMKIGKVLGKSISVQEFQVLFDEYQEVVKMQKGDESLTEDEMNQVKDAVWNTYVQQKIVENETSKLGLEVTDEEMQNILNQGTNPMLQQVTFFVDEQTGLFDANLLKKFLADYKAQQATNPQLAQQYQSIYHFWTFIERNLRQQVLYQKYQALFSNCFLTNPVESKATFESTNEEATIELAAFPYNSVEDSKIDITTSDLKNKYEEVKALFRQYTDTRDVKYIAVQVDASKADRTELENQFAVYASELSETNEPAEVVRKSTSLITYLGLPVKKNAYPIDISNMIDSLQVGQTSRVFETKRDNTLNLVKVVAKENLPDSVEYRRIQVFAEDPAVAHASADSIYDALKAGADFELVAKNYGQTGESVWLTTAQYQASPTLDINTREYLSDLNTMAVGELKNMVLDQGNIIYQVVARRAFIDKYICAVVKKTIDFSHETYSAAYNKFASFVSGNQTGEELVANAEKNGYTVREMNDLNTSAHNLANIKGTRETLKWLFEAKVNSVSPMYECGDNNQLLVVVLDKINKKGYRDLNDPQVMDYVKMELSKEKKSEVLLADMKDVKSIAEATKKGAKTAEVKQITFSSPVFVTVTGASEAPLAGAVASTAMGKFSKQPVVGDAGVYVYQVTNKTKREGEYDPIQMKTQIRQKAMQAASNFMNELYLDAEVVDNRYLFF